MSWHTLDYRITVQGPGEFSFTLEETLRGSLILGRAETRRDGVGITGAATSSGSWAPDP